MGVYTRCTSNDFIASTNRLQSTNAARPDGVGTEQIQNLVHTYDVLGNMTMRSDLLRGLTETFTFDDFNRLTSATVSQNGTTLDIVDYDYDELGNLTHKSDITSLGSGALAYAMTGNAGPHALSSINDGATTHPLSYDANGNLTSGDALGSGRSISWTSYDMPGTITQGAITRTFAYGPDRARYQQTHTNGSDTDTFTYVGDYYTRIAYHSGAQEHKLYIKAGEQAIAILVDDADTQASSTDTQYLHRDHLGSITTIVDSAGTEALSYDVFGRRRDATDWVGAAATPSEERGYTGHEHLDDVNLIHMNGRIYDPVMARMASADPVLQSPLNSQNYNRYSYVLNNPLKYTDPSGFIYVCVGGSGVFGGGNWQTCYEHIQEEMERCQSSFNPMDCMSGNYGAGGGAGEDQSGAGGGNAGDGNGGSSGTGNENTDGAPDTTGDGNGDGVSDSVDTGVAGGDSDPSTETPSKFTGFADITEPSSPATGAPPVTSIKGDQPAIQGVGQAAAGAHEGSQDRLSTDILGISVALAGIATGLGEYSNEANGRWRGANGKWYSNNWGGNQWTGARSNVLETAKRFRAAGTGIFTVGSVISVIDGAEAYSNGDTVGVARSAMDVGWGAAATFGGVVGFTGAASYTGTSLLIELPSVRSVTVEPIADGLCYITSNC